MPAIIALDRATYETRSGSFSEEYTHATGSTNAHSDQFPVPAGSTVQVRLRIIATNAANAMNTQYWVFEFCWSTAKDSSASAMVGTLNLIASGGSIPPDGSLSAPTVQVSGNGFQVLVPGLSSGVLTYMLSYTFIAQQV